MSEIPTDSAKPKRDRKEYYRKYRARPEIAARILELREKPERKLQRQVYEMARGWTSKRKEEMCNRQIKQNNKTQGRKNHRKLWTEQEILLIWNSGFTTMKLAEMLDRTYQAVKSARIRYAAKMPDGYAHNGMRKEHIVQEESQDG